MAGILKELLGAYLGGIAGGDLGNVSSIANPAFGVNDVDEFGNPIKNKSSGLYTDSFGNPITDQNKIDAYQKSIGSGQLIAPYNQLNRTQASANPGLASWIAQQNAEYQNAPSLAQRQNQIKQQVAGGNAQLVAPWTGHNFNDVTSNNPRAASVLFPNLSTEGITSGNTAAEEQRANVPTLTANALANNRLEALRQSNEALKTGLPEATAQSELARNNYLKQFYPSQGGLLPSQTYREEMQNLAGGDEAKRLVNSDPILTGLYGSNLAGKVSEAKVNEALTKERAASIPLLSGIQHLQELTAAREASHPPTPTSPFNINPNTGLPERTPGYVGTIPAIGAKLGTDKMVPSGIPFSGGMINLGPEPTKTATTPLPSSSITPTAPVFNRFKTNRAQTVNTKEQQRTQIDKIQRVKELQILLSHANTGKGTFVSPDEINQYQSELEQLTK